MASFVDGIDRLAAREPGARVLVGMSGGVDSSVAAMLLRDAGFEVVGVSLHLWDHAEGQAGSRCCAPEDLEDARRTADALGIAYFTFDERKAFARTVVAPFVDDYLDGRTPSPCVACNREVKIAAFIELCARLGAAAFATGHYARTGFWVDDDGGALRPALMRGDDAQKDQSYFLHGVGPRALSLLVTPLGRMRKPEVRALAERAALPNAGKPDSEDLCFVAGDHARFVEARAAGRVRPGPIVDGDGRVVGRHEGIHRFTIGQRKGLGVAIGKPAYVASIDADAGVVRLGDDADLAAVGALVKSPSLLDPDLVGARGRRLTARVRYRHDGAPAEVEVDPRGDELRVRFLEPARAVTPGQTCVLYDGAEVLGGGTIERALGAEAFVARS